MNIDDLRKLDDSLLQQYVEYKKTEDPQFPLSFDKYIDIGLYCRIYNLERTISYFKKYLKWKGVQLHENSWVERLKNLAAAVENYSKIAENYISETEYELCVGLRDAYLDLQSELSNVKQQLTLESYLNGET